MINQAASRRLALLTSTCDQLAANLRYFRPQLIRISKQGLGRSAGDLLLGRFACALVAGQQEIARLEAKEDR